MPDAIHPWFDTFFTVNQNGQVLTCLIKGSREEIQLVKTWDTRTGKELSCRPAKPSDFKKVGRAIEDERLRVVWDDRPHDLQLGPDLQLSPDGKRLAKIDFDGMVRFRDVATGQEVFTFRGHRPYLLGNNNPWCLAFSPNGNHLAISREDGVFLLSAAPRADEPAAAKRMD
jgi:WD40 repeat protein